MTFYKAASRFYIVVKLFIDIFLSFYSLRYKRLWHSKVWVEEKKKQLYVSQARYFRETAISLGGLLIKLGQFLSTRVDLLPRSSIDVLAGLQDEVPGVDYTLIKQLADSEFGKDIESIYAAIDTSPIASASLGQVHHGTLVSGEKVAIKIMRPGIEELVRIDLKAIKNVVLLIKLFTDWNSFIDLDAIYQEFHDTIWDELDYLQEGQNAEKISANSRDDEDFLAPGIYWEYTTKRVLTMEYMEGIKINDYAAIEELGLDRKLIAARLLEIYVRQILVDGFYHADPHPGNLFVTTEGRIIMVDFGMVGAISVEMRVILVDMVKAIVSRDYPAVVNYFKQLGFLRVDADNNTVTRAVSLFLEHTLGSSFDISSADLNLFLQDLEVLLYEQPFQVPARFTFLGRALGTLYGICIGLDPGINFIDVSRPYVDKFLGSTGSSYWDIIKEKTTDIATSLIELPSLMNRVLSRAERGDLYFRMSAGDLAQKMAENTSMLRSITWALVFGFTLMTSAYLLVHNYNREAYSGFGMALIFLLLLLRNVRGSGTRRRKAPHPPVMVRRGT